MKGQVSVSDELSRIHAEFEPFEKTGHALSGEDITVLRARLMLLARLARNQEQELSIFRLMEASRRIGGDIDAVTASVVRLDDYRGVVIRPDFSGDKKP